jgi:hypothetical protein
VKAAQDEASTAALRRNAPESQDHLLAEQEGLLRRYLSEAHDAESANPFDGHAKHLTAIDELAKSAEKKTNYRVRLGSIPCPEL